MSITYPRYLTFSPQELEGRLRELDNTPGRASALALTMKMPQGMIGGSGISSGRSRLIKRHTCSVWFPDGVEGCCQYLRGGPTWHIFKYEYSYNGSYGYGHEGFLIAVNDTRRLVNTVVAIEQDAQENALKAYADAIERERREYFMRATEVGWRKKRPASFQMRALRAKALSGKYAVCCRMGKKLLPLSSAHDRLDDANEEWLTKHNRNPSLVVACCNRLDRCWELPRFNTLYATFDPRPKAITVSGGQIEAQEVVEAVEVNGEQDEGEQDEEDWDYLPDSEADDADDEGEMP